MLNPTNFLAKITTRLKWQKTKILLRWHKLPRFWRLFLLGITLTLLIAGIVALIRLKSTAPFGPSHFEAQQTFRDFLKPFDKFAAINQPLTPSPLPQPTLTPTPAQLPNPLNGILMPRNKYNRLTNQRRVLAVLIENHPAARPQSGLSAAELVWEALTEGGITRFLALYWQHSPNKVGPVRSVRTYFLDWASEFADPLLMHIGGALSPQINANAYAYIQKYGLKSLSISTSNTYWREASRFAPHNAYTNLSSLWQKALSLGWKGKPGFGEWLFKDDAPPKQRGPAQQIKVLWFGHPNSYSVTWDYTPQENVYLRSHNHTPHLDAENQTQIRVKNIALAFSPIHPAQDGTSRILYETIGHNRALVFRDGRVIEGEWRKEDRISRTRFYNKSGEEITFNRGLSWIMFLPTSAKVNY